MHPSRRQSVPSLIAWLSLCLLAAAWGNLLTARWQAIWGEMGLFGLISAVGLGATEKIRHMREEQARKATLRVRFESGLARLNEHTAALDSINAAVRKLVEHAAKARFGNLPKGNRAEREAELLAGYPLEITPVDDDESLAAGAKHSVGGTLRQISSAIVAFEHAEPLATRLVLLTFKFATEEDLSFVVDLMWTKRLGQEYVTSGTILASGIPGCHPHDEAKELTAAS